MRGRQSCPYLQRSASPVLALCVLILEQTIPKNKQTIFISQRPAEQKSYYAGASLASR
jgi:hypothetical protein